METIQWWEEITWKGKKLQTHTSKTSAYLLEVSDFWANFATQAIPNKYMVTEPMINALENYFWNLAWKQWIDYWCWIWDVTSQLSNSWADMIWIDISPDQLLKAKVKYSNLDFTNTTDWIKDESIDFIFFKFSLCAMEDETYIKVLYDVYKKLKKDWIIIIWDQNRDECTGKETYCEYYPEDESVENGHPRITILKIWWKKISDWLVKWIDYQEVTDHFRSQDYTKLQLEKVWFKNIQFKFPETNNPSRNAMDEKDTRVYKITTAIK